MTLTSHKLTSSQQRGSSGICALHSYAYAHNHDLEELAHLTIDFVMRSAYARDGNDLVTSAPYMALSTLTGLAGVCRTKDESRTFGKHIWAHMRGLQNMCMKELVPDDHVLERLKDLVSGPRWIARYHAFAFVKQTCFIVKMMVWRNQWPAALAHAREQLPYYIAALNGPDGKSYSTSYKQQVARADSWHLGLRLYLEDEGFLDHFVLLLFGLVGQAVDVICRFASHIPVSTDRNNWLTSFHVLLMNPLEHFKPIYPEDPFAVGTISSFMPDWSMLCDQSPARRST